MTLNSDIIRIAVADDDLSVLQLFSNHVNSLENCKVLLQANDGIELLEMMKKKPQIDLVIIDIVMPIMSGYEITAVLRNMYPELRVLFYSGCKNELALQLMALSGGHGLILKGKGVDEASKAIKSVIGGTYYYPSIAEEIRISEKTRKFDERGFNPLSEMEIKFMRFCVSEMPYKEMACALKITNRQLEHFRETVFKKMKVQCRVGLVLKALESGMARIPQVNNFANDLS